MIDYFKNNFEKIDKNGDGKLDREELLECCVKVIQKQYDELQQQHTVLHEQSNPAQQLIDEMFNNF